MLPPCRQTLAMKIRRTQFVATLWTHAATPVPGDGLSPTDYGWCVSDNLLTPIWFEGPTIPDTLFSDNTSGNMEIEDGNSELDTDDDLDTESDEAWSEDSDEEEEGVLLE